MSELAVLIVSVLVTAVVCFLIIRKDRKEKRRKAEE